MIGNTFKSLKDAILKVESRLISNKHLFLGHLECLREMGNISAHHVSDEEVSISNLIQLIMAVSYLFTASIEQNGFSVHCKVKILDKVLKCSSIHWECRPADIIRTQLCVNGVPQLISKVADNPLLFEAANEKQTVECRCFSISMVNLELY